MLELRWLPFGTQLSRASRNRPTGRPKLLMPMAAIYFAALMACFALSVDSFALNLNPSKIAMRAPAVTSHIPCCSTTVRANLMTMKVFETSFEKKSVRTIIFKAGACIRSLILSIFLLFSSYDESFSTSRMPVRAENYLSGSVASNTADCFHHRPAFINTAKRIENDVQNSGSSIMLSMTTAESKKKLVAIVSGAYAVIWAFLFFSHDQGEKSE
jgi:hypothetical protein